MHGQYVPAQTVCACSDRDLQYVSGFKELEECETRILYQNTLGRVSLNQNCLLLVQTLDSVSCGANLFSGGPVDFDQNGILFHSFPRTAAFKNRIPFKVLVKDLPDTLDIHILGKNTINKVTSSSPPDVGSFGQDKEKMSLVIVGHTGTP